MTASPVLMRLEMPSDGGITRYLVGIWRSRVSAAAPLVTGSIARAAKNLRKRIDYPQNYALYARGQECPVKDAAGKANPGVVNERLRAKLGG